MSDSTLRTLEVTAADQWLEVPSHNAREIVERHISGYATATPDSGTLGGTTISVQIRRDPTKPWRTLVEEGTYADIAFDKVLETGNCTYIRIGVKSGDFVAPVTVESDA